MPWRWHYALGVMLAGASSTMVWAQPADCQVEHQPYVQSGVAQGHMRVVNDGKGCGFNFRFAGKFDPSSWKVEQPPQHGRVEASGSRVEYFPEAGYAGPDAFTVAVFGVNPMMRTANKSRDGRFAITVDVRATP
jgi:hypothetical protein